MKRSHSKSSETTNVGYNGTLNLLTSQGVAENMFGKNSHMLTSQPNSFINTNNKESTMKYLDLLTLKIFLAVFHTNCIGVSSADTYISVQDLCVNISQLNQNCIPNEKDFNGSKNDLLFLR